MPFLTGFGKRKEIRYGTVFPGANLTDFPKLFKITADSDIAAELASGGGIAVTGSDGTTTVPFGLYPSSNLASGDIILRAKFSPLTAASTGDVLGYLYYDSSGTTSQNKSGVVSNGYALFMPLEDDPSGSAPQMRDWVTDSLIGTSNGSMTSGDLVNGQVGKGLDFDGIDDYVTVGSNLLTGRTALTVSLHLKANTTPGAFDGVLGDTTDNNWGNGFGLHWSSSSQLQFWINSYNANVATSPSVTPTVWNSLDGTYNGATIQLFANGVAGTSDTYASAVTSSGSTFRFGELADAGINHRWNFNGLIDEVRVATVARSTDWIAYGYADDFDNANTFSLGAEETDGGGGGDAGWSASGGIPLAFYAM